MGGRGSAAHGAAVPICNAMLHFPSGGGELHLVMMLFLLHSCVVRTLKIHIQPSDTAFFHYMRSLALQL